MSTELSDLVAFLYRADWKQLSLSATISRTFDPDVARRLSERKTAEIRRVTGPLWSAARFPRPEFAASGPVHTEKRLLVAPGGCYRIEDSHGCVDVCDGERSWWTDSEGTHRELHSAGSLFDGLLTPQWLIACYQLQIAGDEVAGDRAAVRVTGVPRLASARGHGSYYLLDRVEVLVDAELGILLSSRQVFDGQTRESAELRNLVISPPEAGMPGQFAPPPDVRGDDEEPFADFQPPSGTGWEVAGAVAGAASSAVTFAVRHAPRRKAVWPTDDEEPDMPADAVLPASAWEDGQPPDDQTVSLLHRTDLSATALMADVHEWIDVQSVMRNFKAVQEKLPAPLQGIFGPDSVWEAIGERAAEDRSVHRVARLAVHSPGQYRLDYLTGDWEKRYKAIACDGEYTTKLFDGKVATGPAKPLEPGLASMLDPAWLLAGWQLAVIGPASVAGRDGMHIRAMSTSTPRTSAVGLSIRADLVLDTELAVLLRHTTYYGDQPATRAELRGLRPLAEGTPFRLVPDPDMRSTTDSGGPFGDRNLPRPAEAAATAAALAAAGAVAFAGWLEKHRPRPIRDRP